MLNIYIDLFFSKKIYYPWQSLIVFWPKFWGMIPSWNVSGKKQLKYSEGVHHWLLPNNSYKKPYTVSY